MFLMSIGLAIFFTVHLLPTVPHLHDRLVGRLGAGGFRVLHSVLSIVGFGIAVWGYANAPYIPVWEPPTWGRHVTFLFMLPVFPLLVAVFLPGQLKKRIRHPMILAVKIWAFAHLFSRGDAASMLLFGSFLIWAIYARISLARREREGRVTVAIGPARNDLIAMVIGLSVYLAMILWGHGWLIGIDLTPSV